MCRRPGCRGMVLAAVLTAMGGHAGGAAADDGTLALELNKLEPVQGACRVYLTVRSGTQAYDSLNLDLVLFGKDGVIARRLAADVGPLRANKRQVKLFDIPGLDCAGIGSVLVNDVLDCKPGGDASACLDRLQLASRVVGVELAR